MKLLVLIIICSSLSAQCLLQLGLLHWYQQNKAAITEAYCVNKDKPALKCEGKCYLKTQLKKVDQQQDDEKHIEQQTEWPLFLLPVVSGSVAQTFYRAVVRLNTALKQGYAFLYAAVIFHPPTMR